jgi:hypothetical protein
MWQLQHMLWKWASSRALNVADTSQVEHFWVASLHTGWPTAGEPCCDQPPLGFPSTAQYLAVPSPEANAQYMTRLVNAATATGVIMLQQ